MRSIMKAPRPNAMSAVASRARRASAMAHRRRRMISRAERARARALAELNGNLHAYLMVERLADGQRF